MNVKISELKRFLAIIAKKYVSEDEAEYYSIELTEAYIRKYPRCNILKDEVISDTERQEKYKDHKIKVIKNFPSLMQLDFNRLPITFKLKWIHDTLIEKSEKTGIAILGFDNSGGMHTLHTWTQGIAKRGYFALAGYNGGPLAVVPLKGTRGLLGTNPMSYAFPTNEGEIVVDMATSEIPYFEIKNAKEEGKKLKNNVAVDSKGHVTTDPNLALDEDEISNLLPIGGNYKGYAINYLIEIMTGTLISAKLSNKMDPAYVNEEHGGFIIVININAFGDIVTFKNNISELNKVIRSQKGVDNTKVIVPGDNNISKYKNALEKGVVEVEDDVIKKIKELAK